MAVVFRKGSCLQLKFARFLGVHWSNHVRNCRASVQSCRTYSDGQILTSPIPEFDGLKNIRSYEDLYKFSLEEPDIFWGRLARSRLSWFKDFDEVKDVDMEGGNIKWFLNGKINASVNCIDRHIDFKDTTKDRDRVALIWEKDEPGTEEYITYRQLYEMTNRIANTLLSHGVAKGDPVVLYLPVSPIVVAAMLACSRIGAIHSVVFAGFSGEALRSRINDANAKVVITADQGVRGGKLIELKKIVDAAVAECPNVEKVFVAQRTGNQVPMGKLDVPLEKEMAQQSTECKPRELDSEDFLFFLYTSGSTGKPKGIAHSHGGYLLYAMMTHKLVFNYTPGDIYACVADIGWITGHSYVLYGPLLNGATSVLFESVPTYPNPGRYWEMVQRLKIKQFYGAPTAIRLLLRYGDEWVKKYDRSTLRTLGCVGEPLNHEAWEWYHYVVGDGKCDVVDTWWQTETGGIMIAPRPAAPDSEIISGMPMRPFLGIEPAIVDEKGKEMTGNDVMGALCVKKPWPGMARTIYGHHDRFLETYYKPYPGFYFSGDGGHRHPNGYYQITGRMDDIINVSGHRLGTAEIEDVMDEHDMVAETAVVGFPHEIKGEGVYAFVTLMEDVTEPQEDILKELKDLVKTKIASYAVPEMIQITAGLPKTRSGKIMRRVLRKIAANKQDELGDVSTLADPDVVDAIIKNHEVILVEHQERMKNMHK